MDLPKLRAETPGVDRLIHLNNAGAALQPLPVREAVRAHLDLEDEIGGYEAADARLAAREEARATLGELIGAPAHTIAFQESATAAFNQALGAIPFREGDLILTSRHDYASNQIAYLSLQDRFGIRLERVPDGPGGGVDPGRAVEMIHRLRPRLVAMSHIPTNSGLVQELGPIGAACRERGVPFLVDACQSVGQLPVDVGELGCDFLAATGRKFLRGPRGTGFLHVSERALEMGLEPLLPDLYGADWVADGLYQPAPDARVFELWESAWALGLGLGAAARYALDLGLTPIRDRVRSLAASLRERLSDLPGARVLDRGEELCAIVTAHFAGHDSEALVLALRAKGVNASGLTRVSAVIDFDEKGVEHAVRFSPHYYNTAEELEIAVARVREVLRGEG